MPGYKKPNAHHPMSFNAKRVEAVKAGKDSFEVGGKSFPVTSKAMMYKPQMNKGPYMMKPGRESATRNTPGPFRAEVPYMYNTPNAIKPMMTGKKEVFERTEFPVEGGRFDGLGKKEYETEIRRLRKNKEERDKKQKK